MPIGVYCHKPRPEKDRKKISKTMKKYFKTHPSNTKGMKFSKESCEKMSKSRSGEKHPQWKGGRRHRERNGYILIYTPNHPFKTKKNCVYEHRIIMEKHLRKYHPSHPALIEINGEKYLKSKWIVHHINNIKDDNRIENLKLFQNNSLHSKSHFPKGSKFGIHKSKHH